MGESGGLNGDNINLPQGSFSKLLSSIDDFHRSNINNNSNFHQLSPLFSSNTPNMLCFGDFNSQMSSNNLPCYTSNNDINIRETVSCYTSNNITNSNISSASCGNNITTFSNKRRSGSGQESGSVSGQKNGRKRNNNKAEIMGPTLVVHAKAKREKLGERISTLQQLVCPYGKTDTASVLHEAIGYIRFLHEQVKVLSSPYLDCLPLRHSLPEKSAPTTGKAYDTTGCLRSRGLCLVPVEFIIDVGNTNGADFWSYSTSLTKP